MSSNSEAELNLSRWVDAPPARVFDAWTREEQMIRWSCPDPTARVVVSVDLRVGGRFSIRMEAEGGPYTAIGTYLEVDPPHRVVYTWDWVEAEQHMGVDTVVAVDFVPSRGGTEVRIHHSGFPTREQRDGHRTGWEACVPRLASLAGDV